jgi:hypothetical protein
MPALLRPSRPALAASRLGASAESANVGVTADHADEIRMLDPSPHTRSTLHHPLRPGLLLPLSPGRRRRAGGRCSVSAAGRGSWSGYSLHTTRYSLLSRRLFALLPSPDPSRINPALPARGADAGTSTLAVGCSMVEVLCVLLRSTHVVGEVSRGPSCYGQQKKNS